VTNMDELHSLNWKLKSDHK